MTLILKNRAGELKVNESGFAPQAIVASGNITTTTLGANALTTLDLAAPDTDPYSIVNPTTDRITPKTAGYYDTTLNCGISAGTGTLQSARVYKNGLNIFSAATTNTAYEESVTINAVIWMNGTTDYLDFRVYNYDTSSSRTAFGHFKAVLVGAAVGQVPLPTPAARVKKTSTQTIGSGGGHTAITFDAEDFDNDNIHDNTTNNSRLTCKTPGLYIVEGTVGWSASGTNSRMLFMYVNGLRVDASATQPSGQYETMQKIVSILSLLVNDYVDIRVYQESGGNLTVSTTDTHLAMARMGTV